MFKVIIFTLAALALSHATTCTVGDRQCINAYQFEVCDLVSGSTASFNPNALTCQSGQICQQTTATRVDCVVGPTPSCTVGDRRCVNANQYQVCDLISGPTPSFNPSSLTCQTGQHCQQTTATRVDCF